MLPDSSAFAFRDVRRGGAGGSPMKRDRGAAFLRDNFIHTYDFERALL
jgi:hypothetical protein